MIKSKFVLMAIMACMATAIGAAQVYKWKDAQGQVHYSDVPPPPDQAKSDIVKTGAAPVSSVSSPKAPPIVAKNASQASAAQASAPAQVQKDPKLCQQAKGRKTFLESGKLTKTVNDQGEVEFLTDEKRKVELEDTNKAIERFCP